MTWSRGIAVLMATMFALSSLSAFPAAAQPVNATICSDLATVSWGVDFETVTVETVQVEVLGCDDGEFVGIQLLTDDGDVPADAPLAGHVTDEVATFDVGDLALRVEPVIGIRVFLEVDGLPVELLTLTVEQRFFGRAGNEQVGLRQTSSFTIAPRATYVVPSASQGYVDVDCANVNTTLPEGVIAQGAGEFTAITSGIHVACYQQVPGTPGGPGPGGPGAEPPVVLDDATDVATGDDGGATEGTAVLDDSQATDNADGHASGSRSTTATSVLGRPLARTGVDTTTLLLVGAVLLAIGGRLVLHRRRMSER